MKKQPSVKRIILMSICSLNRLEKLTIEVNRSFDPGTCGRSPARSYSLCPAHLAPVTTQWGNSTFWNTERLHSAWNTSCSLSLSLYDEPRPTDVFSPWLRVLITAPRSCHACHLPGRLTHASTLGDLRSRRGLWAGTQGKAGKGRLSYLGWSERRTGSCTAAMTLHCWGLRVS